MQKHRRRIEPLEIDGSTLEGGGQLLRISAGLAALTGTPIHIINIRAGRSGGGGLKAQHLACIKWLAEACNARLEGAEKGSKDLLFVPGTLEHLSPVFKKKPLPDKTHAYECHIDIGTAGATTLALQAILPFILFYKLPSELPVHLTLTGGTNVSNSPSSDYVRAVFLPTLRQIGFPDIQYELHKRGYFYGGASIGSFTIIIPPRKSLSLPGFTYAPPDPNVDSAPPQPTTMKATFLAPLAVHACMCNALAERVSQIFASDMEIEFHTEDTKTPKRCYVLLILEFEGTHLPTRRLARDCLLSSFPKARSLEKQVSDMIDHTLRLLQREWKSGAWADEFMRDQLVIYQGLANDTSQVWGGLEDAGEGVEGQEVERELREPSLHARTAEWVVRKILGVKFDVEGRCKGIGFGGEEVPGLEEGLSRLELADT